MENFHYEYFTFAYFGAGILLAVLAMIGLMRDTG